MRINKFIKAFIFCAAVCVCAISCSPVRQNLVCHQNQCVKVDLATTAVEHERGLQGRVGLTDDEGMLFIFSASSRYQFWMKDMKFPIDIIWINYAQRVVYIASEVPPCLQEPCAVYTPTKEALYALEIKSGQARKMGIVEGSRLEFRLKN